MRAIEFINEISHAHELSDLTDDIDSILPSSTLLGKIDHLPVYCYRIGQQELFFLLLDGRMAALVLVTDQTDIRAIKSNIKKGGAITALVAFIVRQLQRPLSVRDDEALTDQGFQWLYNIIKSGGRGLTFTDQNGNPIDVDALTIEWQRAKMTDAAGPTKIVIEGNVMAIPNINEGLLLPKTRYLGDQENL